MRKSSFRRLVRCWSGSQFRVRWSAVLVSAAWLLASQGLRAQVPAQLAGYSRQLPHASLPHQGPHSGVLRSYEEFQVETVLSRSGLQVYVTDPDGRPFETQATRGVAMVKVAGESKRYRFDLLPSDDGMLSSKANLSRIDGKQVELEVMLVLPPSQVVRQGVVKYRDIVTVAPSVSQLAAAAIVRQGVCPVSGRPLGSMGDPVAVTIEGKTVYACCSSCVSSIKSQPGKYATGRPTILVSTATSEDAAGIARQKVCPVMDEPLGGMGQPIKVMIGDKPIYLCCRGCIKKVEAEPRKYLDMVYSPVSARPQRQLADIASSSPATESSGLQPSVGFSEPQVRPGIFQVSHADKAFIAAQKRCPVMDEPLDAMGGPYKVNADGRAIYICCPGCAKRIAAEPAKYINLLKEQGVDAPIIR